MCGLIYNIGTLKAMALEFKLREEVSFLAQKDLTINAYYTKFKSVWDEYSNYRSCSCGHQVKDCTMSFLIGLNDTYAAVREQILLMDPIPSLTKVFSHLAQDEKQKKIGARKKLQVDLAALIAKNNPVKGSAKGKSRCPQCTHCCNLVHVVDKCYNLHGYPPSFKFKSNGQQASSFANNAIVVEDNSDQGVNLTHAEYQQLFC